MSINLIIVSSIFCLTIIFLMLYLIKKEKINIKYALVWLMLFGFLLISILIPGFLEWITHALGFQISSNMVLSIILGLLVIINISLTGIVSSQDKKIRILVQEVSLLKGQSKNDNN